METTPKARAPMDLLPVRIEFVFEPRSRPFAVAGLFRFRCMFLRVGRRLRLSQTEHEGKRKPSLIPSTLPNWGYAAPRKRWNGSAQTTGVLHQETSRPTRKNLHQNAIDRTLRRCGGWRQCSRLYAMRKKRVDIRRNMQNAESPVMAYVIVLLFFICFLIFLWVVVVGTRFIVG